MKTTPPRRWADRPLRHRLTIFALGLVAVAALALSVVNILRETASFNAQLEDQAELFLNTLAYSMRNALYRLEVDELSDLARVIAREEVFTELRVYDGRGFIIADANASGPVFSNAADPFGLQLVQAPDEEIVFELDSDELLAGRKIQLGAQTIGALSIGLSTDTLDREVWGMVLQSLGLAILVMLIAAIVASTLAAGITQPLNQLTEIAGRMSQGQTTVRAIVLAEDEVGLLGRSFNQMSSAIEQRERELRDLAQSLEQTVQARTAELQGANAQLLDEVERRKLSEAALLVAKDEALESSRLKTSLLANVSHDLRTPLNIIFGYAEILREGQFGELNEKGQEMANSILRSAGKLLDFVNNLLSQAQIESGKLEIHQLPFKVQSIVENARSVSEILARAKGLDLAIQVGPDLPAEMIGDVRWINQIVYNLVTNAVKFTDRGSVTVSIQRLNQQRWTIEVQDSGIGIRPDVQARIFEPFYRVSDPDVQDIPGSGIGLSIVRQLTEALGGQLTLKSTPGQGSTFTVELPLHLQKAHYHE